MHYALFIAPAREMKIGLHYEWIWLLRYSACIWIQNALYNLLIS